MIKRLIVKNYKRFDSLDLKFNDDLNIIVGDNESGKSTILECINLALNFKINGRFPQGEISPFLFHKTVVDKYLAEIRTNGTAILPEIFIEIYFNDDDQLAHLKGSMNSIRTDATGVKVIIKFDESYRAEYLEFIAKNKEKVTTIPIEYYHITWFSFADAAITSRNVPMVSAMLDATSIRLQSGTDSYIKSVISESLDSKQKAELSLAFRHLKEGFFNDPSIDAINKTLEKRRGDITDKDLKVSLDVSQKNGWDSHLMPYLDKIPFHYSGMGEQSSLKLLLTLNKDGEDSHIILIEEIENHLSFSNMARLLKRVKDKCDGKQIIITTHSTYVLNKLGIDSLILIGKENSIAKLSELTADTRDYFEKLPGYDTLRMILADRSILVEGPSDELIVQRAYLDINGNLPIEDSVDVISLKGLAFKRFLDIAILLKTLTSVITDNDEDYQQNINVKYADYLDDENIKIYASEDESLPTLEPQIVSVNSLETLNSILGTSFESKEGLVAYMTNKNNKTDCALKIFNSVQKIKFPKYVIDAINREE
jgi:predicted ATP-dependent endonuclease of OLD family